MGQYDTDGCPLDMSECTTDKRELINGIAEVPMNAEDPNKTGNILLSRVRQRELVFIYLLSDERASMCAQMMKPLKETV